MKRLNIVLLSSTVLVLAVVLFFGLRPKGYDFSNHVTRNTESPGIRFEKYGIAYAQLDPATLERIGSGKGFSLLLVLQSERLDHNGSGHILTIHAGEDKTQLVVWQWFAHIIAMNDNDYAHRRKVGRVSAKLSASSPQQAFLSLTTGPKGTSLYFNGKIVESNPTLHLNIPVGNETTLVLGNSVYGTDPWQGSISALAMLDCELSPGSVLALYDSWAEKRALTGIDKKNLLLNYLFNERDGTEILNHANGSAPLSIPARATPLRTKFLAETTSDSGPTESLVQDVIINLAGFFPLGFLLGALLMNIRGIPDWKAIIYTVLFCFTVSVAIEAIQAWVPSRSPQSLDLLLNTVGAWIGAILAARVIPKKHFHNAG